MPFKNHEKYLEYQRSYYRNRKGNSYATQGLNRTNISNRGLTEGLNKNLKSTLQSRPQQQGVTSTVNPSIPKGLKASIPSKPSFPLNPVKPSGYKAAHETVPANTRPVSPKPVWSDKIWENTRKHVEELRRQGYEVDGLGNASRIVKE